MSYYKLNTQIRQASEAFMSGLSDIINPDWLKMFDQVFFFFYDKLFF